MKNHVSSQKMMVLIRHLFGLHKNRVHVSSKVHLYRAVFFPYKAGKQVIICLFTYLPKQNSV